MISPGSRFAEPLPRHLPRGPPVVWSEEDVDGREAEQVLELLHVVGLEVPDPYRPQPYLSEYFRMEEMLFGSSPAAASASAFTWCSLPTIGQRTLGPAEPRASSARFIQRRFRPRLR